MGTFIGMSELWDYRQRTHSISREHVLGSVVVVVELRGKFSVTAGHYAHIHAWESDWERYIERKRALIAWICFRWVQGLTRRRQKKYERKNPKWQKFHNKGKNGQKNKIKRGDNGGKKQTRENLSQVLDVGVNEQEAFEGCLEVRGESHHCVPHAHRIDGSNSQRAVAM